MVQENQEFKVYLVDRDLPGITMDQLVQAQQAAISTSRKFTADGIPVRYIRSTFIPGESRLMCLFESGDAGSVKSVNEAAHLPYTRVVEALDLTP